MSASKKVDYPVAIVTGSSRGIGAATAELLAKQGYHVVVNYREKAKRAEQVVAKLEELGGGGLAAQADLTDYASVDRLVAQARDAYGAVDLLILNASGGMEKGMPEDYAMRLNRDAQVNMLRAVMPIMHPGSRVVFVTSHQAHFVRTAETLPEYVPVAETKRAGEDALREIIPQLDDEGIEFVVVSGDMIVGTVTATLLNRLNPGAIETRTQQVGKLYTVEEFAEQIVDAVAEPVPADHTKYVGDVSDFLGSAPSA